MQIEPTENYDITGHRMYFSGESLEALKHTAEKLGNDWACDPVNYSLVCTYDGIITVTGETVKTGMRNFHHSGNLIALLKELKYRGSGVCIAPDILYTEMLADGI